MSASMAELEVRRDRLRAALGRSATCGRERWWSAIANAVSRPAPAPAKAIRATVRYGTLVFRERGKSRARVIPPEAVARTRAQIEEDQRLRALAAELVEVGEGLCHARPTADPEVKKGGFAVTVAAEFGDESERLIGAGAAHGIDFEALERADRDAALGSG